MQQTTAKNKTDGQIALLINRVVKSMIAIYKLKTRGYGAEALIKREADLRNKCNTLISEICDSEHPNAALICESARSDYAADRFRFIAAGARRYFEFPLNWEIVELELIAIDAYKMREKKIAKSKAKILKGIRRPAKPNL